MKKLEINKKDIEYNLNEIKKRIEGKNVNIIAVVKANGMGLDLVKYSKFLVESGINTLAVANFDEAIDLRLADINEEILMLSPIITKNELQELIEKDITLTIGSFEEFEMIENICSKIDKKAKAHIKIDTGFGRYGFLYDDKDTVLEMLKKVQNVEITGMFTHFSNAKNEKDTRLQFNRFISIINYLKDNGYSIDCLHCSASTAFIKYPDMMLNSVRLGSIIQGRTLYEKEKFKKVGKFKSIITEIKELPKGYNISYGNTYKTKQKTKVAIVPVGYMDGLNKDKLRDDFSLKNNIISVLMEFRKIFTDNSIKVKIENTDYKIIGRLGMYHSIVDISGAKNIKVGDEVELSITPLQTNEKIRREYI